jgi:hypothetical protein
MSIQRRLRSSRALTFEAEPLECPPVELSGLLQRAVVFDSDDMMEPEVPAGKRCLSEAFAPAGSSGARAMDGPRSEGVEVEEGEIDEGSEGAAKRSRRSLYRAKRRDAEVLASGQHPKPEQVRKQARDDHAIKVAAELKSLPSSSCGYRAYAKKRLGRKTPELDELLQKGYTVIEWDGR